MGAENKKRLNKELLNVFCKPWKQVDRVRDFIGERDNIYRVSDVEVAQELGLAPTTVGAMKYRNSPVFTLYVLKWCLKNNLDPLLFIKK